MAQAILGLPNIDIWEGTSGELLSELAKAVPDNIRSGRQWPNNARGLSAALKRLAPDLRRMGLEVILPAGLTGHAGQRLVTLKRLMPGSAENASAV